MGRRCGGGATHGFYVCGWGTSASKDAVRGADLYAITSRAKAGADGTVLNFIIGGLRCRLTL